MRKPLLIFDLDGTLIDSVRPHVEASRAIARRHGLSITDEEFARYNGMNAKDGFHHLLEEKGVHISDARFLFERLRLLPRVLRRIALFPSSVACLERLEDYPKAVATSSPRWYMRHFLRKFGIRRHFAFEVSTGDVKNGKPAPDIFLEAARRAGRTPLSCVVIEDSLNGVIAANRAGMTSIVVLTTTPKRMFVGEASPDLIIRTLDDLDEKSLGEAMAAKKRRKARR